MDDIIQGDALTVLKTLPDQCVQTCVTSPPYFGLRCYGSDKQLGLEKTPEEYVARLVAVFREVRRVLKDNGTLWVNLGDSYAGGGRGGDPKHRKGDNSADATAPSYRGISSKNLVGIPWRVAFALQADGWYLRQDIIWHKPNPMPESVTDRCTKAHEYIFLLSKSSTYYFDADAIRERTGNEYTWDEYAERTGKGKDWQHGKNRRVTDLTQGMLRTTKKDGGKAHPNGRNKRSVWTVTTKPYKGAHFATFPPDLIKPCILAGAPYGYTVLDPFLGSGTTAAVAKQLGRHYLGIELNPEYIELARQRIGVAAPSPSMLLAAE